MFNIEECELNIKRKRVVRASKVVNKEHDNLFDFFISPRASLFHGVTRMQCDTCTTNEPINSNYITKK